VGHRPRCAQPYRPADTCRDSRHTAPADGHYTPQRALRNQSHGLAGCGEIRRGSRFPYSPQSVGWSGKLWRDSASKSPIVRNPSHGLARGDCPRCADDRRRMYVMDNHERLTPPALALRECVSPGDLRLPLHARYPATGAYVPSSWLYMRLCIAKVVIPPAEIVHPSRSGGREPAVVCGYAFATALVAHGRLTSTALGGGTCVQCEVHDWRCTNASAQERRASARRGWRKRICKGDTANMRETAAAGLVDVIALAVAGEALVVFRVTARWHCEYASANHGGLTPPLLCRTNARLLGIFDFRCKRVTQPRGVDAPALALHECASAGDLRFPVDARYPTTGG
jgi:hypothetical protein